MPDFWRRYEKWDQLTPAERRMLKEKIYGIGDAHIAVWGLGNIKQASFFNSVQDAFIQSFPELDLNPSGFVRKWKTFEEGRESVRFAVQWERPDLWEAILRWHSLDSREQDRVRREFYKIKLGHF